MPGRTLVLIVCAATLCLGGTGVSSAARGGLLWFNNLQLASWSQPVVIGEKVFYQFQDGGVGCYRVSGGQQVWKNTTTEGGVTSPVYENGRLYLMGYNTFY
mgnify:FL=1